METKTPKAVLTRREREIVFLVSRGLTNQDIATQLGISTRTVKSTLHRVCIKVGAENRSQAVIQALLRRAIDIQEIVTLDELVKLLQTLDLDAIDTVTQNLRAKYEKGKLPAGVKKSLVGAKY